MLSALSAHLSFGERLASTTAPAHILPLLRDYDAVPFDPASDALLRYTREHDAPAHADDPERNGRMIAALEALSPRPSLPTWLGVFVLQRIVLGDPNAALRPTDAHARGGAHTYPMRADLALLWEESLLRLRDEATHPLVAAVRLYFDAIFLHPFVDGNARLARLLFDWTLRARNRPVPSYDSLVRVPKEAGDEASFWRTVSVAALSTVAQTRRCPHS